MTNHPLYSRQRRFAPPTQRPFAGHPTTSRRPEHVPAEQYREAVAAVRQARELAARLQRERQELLRLHTEQDRELQHLRAQLDRASVDIATLRESAVSERVAPEPDVPELQAPEPAGDNTLTLRLEAIDAEMASFKKRLEREHERNQELATDEIAAKTLPVLDDLDRALAHAEAKVTDSVYQGLNLTRQRFEAVLKTLGVVAVEVDIGAAFDPNRHEAVGKDETAEVTSGTIAKVVARGFIRDGRLLRPAMVIVAA